jgi:transposase
MSNVRYVGLDVHKEFIVMAVADSSGAPAEILRRLECSAPRVLAALRQLGPLSAMKVCYEAGPTGYGLYRCLRAAGVDCQVIAPALVPKQNKRVKTDRRDARKLAHFLRSGDLVSVWVPDEQTEALRDLERARDDARLALRRIQQQLLKLLLRNGRVFTEGKQHWTRIHWNWIRRQRFTEEPQQRVLADALRTIEQAQARVARLDEDLAECISGWRLLPLVQNLQAFRGIQLLTAVGVAAEIGDFQRFPTAGKFMAFVGLVPSEESSGASRRQGGITKTGNRHVRRLLLEAAWQYVGAPATIGPTLAQRRAGCREEVVAIADQALRRLRRKSWKLAMRKKPSCQIATALARELAGFIWSAARTTNLLSCTTTACTNTHRRTPAPQPAGGRGSERVGVSLRPRRRPER